MKSFLGKSQRCTMTALSGAFDKSYFDGNTILLKVGIENGKNKYNYTCINKCFKIFDNTNLKQLI